MSLCGKLGYGRHHGHVPVTCHRRLGVAIVLYQAITTLILSYDMITKFVPREMTRLSTNLLSCKHFITVYISVHLVLFNCSTVACHDMDLYVYLTCNITIIYTHEYHWKHVAELIKNIVVVI